jgi:hypothetical protein
VEATTIAYSPGNFQVVVETACSYRHYVQQQQQVYHPEQFEFCHTHCGGKWCGTILGLFFCFYIILGLFFCFCIIIVIIIRFSSSMPTFFYFFSRLDRLCLFVSI